MNQGYKPVPQTEALRYKGTPEKPDIKIFVSHRIDLDAQTIDNPLYIPVRCGAVYDERENVAMLGDDTGDNISEKRMSYCELTVQYWAWKNVQADYYGLCHYRRLFSFSDNIYKEVNVYNHIVEKRIDEELVSKYCETEDQMIRIIEKYDAISIDPMDVKKALGNVTVYESLKNNPLTYDIDAVDLFVEILKAKYPVMAEEVDEYLNGYSWQAWNCFILKKELFFEYSEMLFDVFSELEKKLNTENYNQEQYRLMGALGEIFCPIYYRLQKKRKAKTKELQLIEIQSPQKKVYYKPAFQEKCIAVTIASSEEYAPFLGVLLESIKSNSSYAYNYDIIILSNKISDKNKKILQKIVENKNFSLRFFEVNDYIENRKLYTRDHVTGMTYVRLAVMDIFREYEKVIYLDCDTVVNKDLAELFNTNLKNNYIAAVRDTVMAGWCNGLDAEQKKYNESVLNVDGRYDYFNGGVLLFNIVELKKVYTANNLLEMASSRKWKWFDQEVLNIVCKNRVVFLEQNWNYMAHVYVDEPQLPEYFAPLEIYKNYCKAQKEPWIIHYAGGVIPCYAPQVDSSYQFWNYARKTPYYEEIMRRMWISELSKSVVSESAPEQKTQMRKLADKIMPEGSRRRSSAKKILPKGTRRWALAKQIYYIFAPRYRRSFHADRTICK